MLLHKQCCTFKQAKRLKELGVVQRNSLFYHTSSHWGILPEKSIDFTGNPHSAFNVAELVQMSQNTYNIDYSSEFKKYYSVTDVKGGEREITYFDTFAEACADKLIRGLERGYISIEEVNKRLVE